MRVVIDTNIIFPDFNLTSPKTRMLLFALRHRELVLCVSEIVIDEICGKASKALLETRRQVLTALDRKEARRLPFDLENMFVIPTEAGIVSSVEYYRAKLVAKLIEAGAEIIDYPSIPHQALVRRIGQMKRPFLPHKDDEGYRDALVWETVLELASSTSESTIFVSSDNGFQEDGKLHPDLMNDLELKGLSADKIVFFGSFEAFADRFLSSSLDEVKDIQERIVSEMYAGILIANVIRQRLPEAFHGYILDPREIVASCWVLAAKITSVVEIGDIVIDHVLNAVSGEVFVGVYVDVLSTVRETTVVGGTWPEGAPEPIGGQKYVSEPRGVLKVGIDLIVSSDGSAVTSFDITSVRNKWGVGFNNDNTLDLRRSTPAYMYHEQGKLYGEGSIARSLPEEEG